jgi:hypothetical protein
MFEICTGVCMAVEETVAVRIGDSDRAPNDCDCTSTQRPLDGPVPASRGCRNACRSLHNYAPARISYRHSLCSGDGY